LGKFDNIIIISDVDGTFLGKGSRIVPKNVEAIKYFNQNGGRFTFISGRNPVEFISMISQLTELVNLPVGCCNGIYLYDFFSERALTDITLDGNSLYSVLKDYCDNPDRTIEIFGVHASDFYGFNENDLKFVSQYPERCHIISAEDLKTTPLNKISIIGKKEEIFDIRDNIIQKYPESFYSLHSLPYAVEFIKKGTSKACTVEKIRELTSDKNVKIFAIGDYQNDTEMLSAADFSASPSNALPEISAITDIHVCDHDEGAIADLIRIIEEKYIG